MQRPARRNFEVFVEAGAVAAAEAILEDEEGESLRILWNFLKTLGFRKLGTEGEGIGLFDVLRANLVRYFIFVMPLILSSFLVSWEG